MALFMRLIQRPQLLLRVRRPVVQADDPHGDAEAPAVAVYVADENREDVFAKDGGGHLAALPCYETHRLQGVNPLLSISPGSGM